ncbi:hypothetical protein L345_08757, partial [Ophiophagus hannah]
NLKSVRPAELERNRRKNYISQEPLQEPIELDVHRRYKRRRPRLSRSFPCSAGRGAGKKMRWIAVLELGTVVHKHLYQLDSGSAGGLEKMPLSLFPS